MELNDLVEIVKAHAPMVGQYVLMGLGTLVVLGTSYIKLTPTQDDDMWLQKLEEKKLIGSVLRLLIQFSPLERKELKIEEPKKDA